MISIEIVIFLPKVPPSSIDSKTCGPVYNQVSFFTVNLDWIIIKSKQGSGFQSWHRNFFLDPKIIKTIVVNLGAMKRSDVPGEVFSECADEDSDYEQRKSPPKVGKMVETPVHSGEQQQSTTQVINEIVESNDGGDKVMEDTQHQSATPQVIVVVIAKGKTEETVESNTEELVMLNSPPEILGKLEVTPVERKTEETAILEDKTEEIVEGTAEETVSNAKEDGVEFVGGDQDRFDLGGNDASPILSPKSLFDNSLSPPNEPQP